MSAKLSTMKTFIHVHFAAMFQSWRSVLLIQLTALVDPTTETPFAIQIAPFILALAAANMVGVEIPQRIAALDARVVAQDLPLLSLRLPRAQLHPRRPFRANQSSVSRPRSFLPQALHPLQRLPQTVLVVSTLAALFAETGHRELAVPCMGTAETPPPIAVKDANLGLALVEQSLLLPDQAQPLLMQIQALSM